METKNLQLKPFITLNLKWNNFDFNLIVNSDAKVIIENIPMKIAKQ